jgi:hypothetical protein
MAPLFLQSLCQQIGENDPDLEELSLISLPLWKLSKEDLESLTSAIAQNTTIRWLELALLDETPFDLAFLGGGGNSNGNTSLQSLSIHLGSESTLKALSNAISQNKSLQRIQIEWNGDSTSLPPKDTLQELYTSLLPLKSVRIKGLGLDVPTASDNTSPPCWQDVTLESCDLTLPESMEWFGRAAAANNNTNLLQFRLTDCRLSRATLESLADSSNRLQVLDFSNNDLDDTDCVYLSSFLDSSPRLISLSLADNPKIGNLGLQYLCETVSHKIQRLDLSNCQICLCNHHNQSQNGVLDTLVETFPFLQALNVSENPMVVHQLVGALLSDATHLTELVMESMSICAPLSHTTTTSTAELLWIQSTFHDNNKLQHLNLSGNQLGLTMLKTLSECPCDVLVLAGCHIGDEGLANLLSSSSSPSPQSSFGCRWKELHLSYNEIGNEGAKILAHYLPKMHHLTALSLEFNPFDVTGLRHIVQGGLPHRLEQFQVWNNNSNNNHHGAFSSSSSGNTNPAALGCCWNKLEQELYHMLQLNRAGKSLLFSSLPSSLLPWILAEAQEVYGNDAVFDFFRHRPDLAAR